MRDPSRIPHVIAQLERTWEAQPDLSLATLFGILANRGIGWGTGDEELIEALAELHREHPGEVTGYSRASAPTLGDAVRARFLVETEAPAHRVTVDPYRISVRRPAHRSRPGVWGFERIRRCRAGEPLLITDLSGIEHRLGVVSRITLLTDEPTAEVACLDGLEKQGIGDSVYHLEFTGGHTAVLDHGLELYEIGRRSIAQRRLVWQRLATARPGALLSLDPGRGQPLVELTELGAVERIVVLED